MVKERILQIANAVVTTFRVGVSPIIPNRCKRVCSNLMGRLRWLHQHHSRISREKVQIVNIVVWSLLVFLLLVNGLIFIRVVTFGDRVFNTEHIKQFRKLSPNSRGGCAPGYELSPRSGEKLSPLETAATLSYNLLFRLATGRSVYTCKACSVGFSRSSSQPSNCQPCAPGYYQDARGAESCLPCQHGTFTNTTGARSCVKCAPGYYQSLAGQRRCRKCAAGHYQTQRGSVACLQCDEDEMLNYETFSSNHEHGVCDKAHDDRCSVASCFSERCRELQHADPRSDQEGFFTGFLPYFDRISGILNTEEEGGDGEEDVRTVDETVDDDEIPQNDLIKETLGEEHIAPVTADNEDEGSVSEPSYETEVTADVTVEEKLEVDEESVSQDRTHDEEVPRDPVPHQETLQQELETEREEETRPEISENETAGSKETSDETKGATTYQDNDAKNGDEIISNTSTTPNSTSTTPNNISTPKTVRHDHHKSNVIYKKHQRKSNNRILRNFAIKINRTISSIKESISSGDSTANTANNNTTTLDPAGSAQESANIENNIEVNSNNGNTQHNHIDGMQGSNNHQYFSDKGEAVKHAESDTIKDEAMTSSRGYKHGNMNILKDNDKGKNVVEKSMNIVVIDQTKHSDGNKKDNLNSVYMETQRHGHVEKLTELYVCDLLSLEQRVEPDWEKLENFVYSQVDSFVARVDILVRADAPVTWIPVIIAGVVCYVVLLLLLLKLVVTGNVNSNAYTFLYLLAEMLFLVSLMSLEEKISPANYFLTVCLIYYTTTVTTVTQLLDSLQKAFPRSLAMLKMLSLLVLPVVMLLGILVNMDCVALFDRKYNQPDTDSYTTYVVCGLKLVSIPFVLITIDREIQSTPSRHVQEVHVVEMTFETLKAGLLLYSIVNVSLISLLITLSANVCMSVIQVLLWERFIIPPARGAATDEIIELTEITDLKKNDIVTYRNTSVQAPRVEISEPNMMVEKSDLWFDRGRLVENNDVILYQNKQLVEEMVSFNSTSECKLYLAHMTGAGISDSLKRDFEKVEGSPTSSCGSADDFVIIPKIVVGDSMPLSSENCLCVQETSASRRRYKSAESAISYLSESEEGKELETVSIEDEAGTTVPEERRCKSSMMFTSTYNVAGCTQCRKTRL